MLVLAVQPQLSSRLAPREHMPSPPWLLLPLLLLLEDAVAIVAAVAGGGCAVPGIRGVSLLLVFFVIAAVAAGTAAPAAAASARPTLCSLVARVACFSSYFACLPVFFPFCVVFYLESSKE